MATFVFFALNAAAFTSPLTGPKGYIRNPFKITRFWLIPFCVSSISVACNAAEDECQLLFPTDKILCIYLICIMIGIMLIGSIIHYCILPKCPCSKYNKNAKKNKIGINSNESNINGFIDESRSLASAESENDGWSSENSKI